MPAPQSAIDAREGAIAKFLEARSIFEQNADADGTLTGPSIRQYDQALSEARKLNDRFLGMTNADDRARFEATGLSVDEAIERLTGRTADGGRAPGVGLRTKDGVAVPAGSRSDGASAANRPGFAGLGPSWAESIFRGRDFTAGLIDPSGGVAVAVPLRTGVIEDPRRARFIRELVPEDGAPAGMYAYLKQTARTFRAAAVPKLGRKPTSNFTLKRFEDRTRTIAHLTEPIARQDLADADAVRQFIDDELRLGLYLELDREMVDAAGAGEELTGFLHAGIGAQATAGDVLATTRAAVTKLQKLEVVPTAWAMNPDDWEAIEMTALSYFFSATLPATPTGIMEQRLWSIPVLLSNAVPSGTALLGDFAGSAVLYTTGQVSIDWSENVFDPTFEGGDGATDFERNAIRFRAEGRWGLAVTRPASFVAVDLSTGS